jgi:hypothetical protein
VESSGIKVIQDCVVAVNFFETQMRNIQTFGQEIAESVVIPYASVFGRLGRVCLSIHKIYLRNHMMDFFKT